MTQTVLLGDIAAAGRSIISGPFGSSISSKFFMDRGVPVIRGNNLTKDAEKFKDIGFVFVSEEKARELNAYAHKDDIILTAAGTLGQIGIITGDSQYSEYVISNKQIRVKVDTKKARPLYVYYNLIAPHMLRLIESQNTGSTIPLINLGIVRRLPIFLPGLNEQDKILNVLCSIDEKIELNRRMNETLEQMGQSLFKHYFIDNPEAKTWPHKSLDEIAEFLNGAAMQKFPPDSSATLPVIKIREMSAGITDNTDLATINIPAKYLVSDGDMLFSWSGTLIVKIWTEGQGALNQHLFKVNSDVYPQWFYYLWTKHYLQQFINTAAGKATTMGHIQRHHLTDAKVSVPSDKKLVELNNIFSPLHQQQITNSVQSRELAKLRDSLLPRLISGKIKI